MARTRLLGTLGLALAATVMAAASARADVIDGDWCYSTNRHLMIKGPSIVTPGGTQLTGNYTRHSFIYVVPASEPGAGQTVNMVLINEDTVNLRMDAGGSQGPIQVWHRCAGPVSAVAVPRRTY